MPFRSFSITSIIKQRHFLWMQEILLWWWDSAVLVGAAVHLWPAESSPKPSAWKTSLSCFKLHVQSKQEPAGALSYTDSLGSCLVREQNMTQNIFSPVGGAWRTLLDIHVLFCLLHDRFSNSATFIFLQELCPAIQKTSPPKWCIRISTIASQWASLRQRCSATRRQRTQVSSGCWTWRRRESEGFGGCKSLRAKCDTAKATYSKPVGTKDWMVKPGLM